MLAERSVGVRRRQPFDLGLLFALLNPVVAMTIGVTFFAARRKIAQRRFGIGEVDDDGVRFSEIRLQDLSVIANAEMSRRGHFAGVFAQSCAARFVDRGDELNIR